MTRSVVIFGQMKLAIYFLAIIFPFLETLIAQEHLVTFEKRASADEYVVSTRDPAVRRSRKTYYTVNSSKQEHGIVAAEFREIFSTNLDGSRRDVSVLSVLFPGIDSPIKLVMGAEVRIIAGLTSKREALSRLTQFRYLKRTQQSYSITFERTSETGIYALMHEGQYSGNITNRRVVLGSVTELGLRAIRYSSFTSQPSTLTLKCERTQREYEVPEDAPFNVPVYSATMATLNLKKEFQLKEQSTVGLGDGLKIFLEKVNEDKIVFRCCDGEIIVERHSQD